MYRGIQLARCRHGDAVRDLDVDRLTGLDRRATVAVDDECDGPITAFESDAHAAVNDPHRLSGAKRRYRDHREACTGVEPRAADSGRVSTAPERRSNHDAVGSNRYRSIVWPLDSVLGDLGGLVGDHGDVEYVIATGIDITERKLEEENKVRRLEAEIARMEHYASPGTTRATGQAFSQQSLSERNQVEVEQLRKSYEETLLAGLEDSMYKTNNRVAERLRALAHSLGRLDAGPKDVVELHVKALRNISVGASAKRARALNEEARLLALELMGYLVTVYRNQVAITSATHTSATDREVSDE